MKFDTEPNYHTPRNHSISSDAERSFFLLSRMAGNYNSTYTPSHIKNPNHFEQTQPLLPSFARPNPGRFHVHAHLVNVPMQFSCLLDVQFSLSERLLLLSNVGKVYLYLVLFFVLCIIHIRAQVRYCFLFVAVSVTLEIYLLEGG